MGKNNVLFVSLGIFLSALLLFLGRYLFPLLFDKPMFSLVIFGGLGLVILVFGMIKSMNKPLMMTGVGILLTSLFAWLLNRFGLTSNFTIFIIFVVLGFVLLFYGVVKLKK